MRRRGPREVVLLINGLDDDECGTNAADGTRGRRRSKAIMGWRQIVISSFFQRAVLVM